MKKKVKKAKIVGKNPLTGKPETQEQRDSRLRSSEYAKDNSPKYHR